MAEGHRDRVTDALRKLIDHAVVTDVPEEDLAEVADTLERIDERLRSYPRNGARAPLLPVFDDLQAVFRGDPIIGEHNAIAPPVEITRDGTIIRGRVTLGAAYEGPPGYVHGAIIAGIFDQILGLANLAGGTPGMTGTLTVRYLRPTPLHTELAFEARTDRIEGRKIIAVGVVTANGEPTAEAEGIFISLKHERAAEFFNRLAD